MNITEIRAQYPQYADTSDMDLAKGLHKKYYADMPFEDFATKIGVAAPKEGSVIKAGLANIGAAYGDVATTLQKSGKSFRESTLGISGFSDETLAAMGETREGLKEQQKAFDAEQLQQQIDRKTFWADMVKQYAPDYNPEEPVRSVLRKAAGSAIGLAGETPLFLAGGGPAGAALKTAVGGSTKLAAKLAIKGGTMAGSFAGESVLRGNDPTAVAMSGGTGFAVGAASLVPKPFKTVAEATALIAAEKAFHGTDITPESFGEVLATLVEIKLLGHVMGKTGSATGEFAKAVKVAKERGKVNDAQAKAMEMAGTDPEIKQAVDKFESEVKTHADQELVPREKKGSEVTQAEEAKKVVDEHLSKQEVLAAERDAKAMEMIDKARAFIEKQGRPIEAAKPAKAAIEPPIQKDFVRVYRSEGKTEEKSGRLVSTDREYASTHRTELPLFYIDLHASDPRLKSLERPEQTFELTPQEAAQLKGISMEPQAEPLVPATEPIQRLNEIAPQNKDRTFLPPLEDMPIGPTTKGPRPTAEEAIAKAKEIVGERKFLEISAHEIAKNPATVKSEASNAHVIEVAARDIIDGIYKPKTAGVLDQATKDKIRELAKKQKGAFDPQVFLPESLVKGADKLGEGIRNVLAGAKVLREYRGNKEGLQREYEEIDRFNKFYSSVLTILQTADMNPNIPGFTKIVGNKAPYVDQLRAWSNYKMTMIEKPDMHVKDWVRLGKDQSDRLGQSLLEETAGGKEFTEADLARFGLDPRARQLRAQVKEQLKLFLDEIEKVSKEDAYRKLEGPELEVALRTIADDMAAMRKNPYFPLSRYGEYGVKVIDGKGDVVTFELFESKTVPNLDGRSQAIGALQLAAKYRNELLNQNWQLTKVYISPDVAIFNAMPPLLAKRLASVLGLDEKQMQDLNDLVYKTSPSQSFRKHLIGRKMTPGWSQDAIRAYANYAFHGANHIARLRYGGTMLDSINDVQASAKALDRAGIDSRARGMLVEHLNDHYNYIMSPKNELAALRATGFVWYLGFMPKAAVVNLTQTMLITYPHLAAKYGDAKSFYELNRAAKDVSFFMKGRKFVPEEVRLLDRLQSEGITNESFASALAGVSEGRFLSRALPSTKAGAAVTDIAGRASYLFSIAEGFNRRTTALATFRLERAKGTPEEQAYTVARETIEKTQYEYASWNRPKFMQGKKSVVFMFMQYLQNTLYFLWRDPGNKRALGILIAAAGLQGIPGMEHIMDLVDKMFTTKNKKFSSREELRNFLNEYSMNPDLIMHGAGRFGFGLPWAARQTGIPIPDVDISASLSLGQIVPGLSPLMQGGDFDRQFSRTAQGAGGAILSIPISMWQAMASDDPRIIKRLEMASPTIIKSGLKAADMLATGEVKTRQGEVINKIDMESAGGKMTALLQAGGFANTQTQQQYEQTFFRKETARFYAERRQILLEALYLAAVSKDKIALAEAKNDIKSYNKEVPYRALGITGDDVSSSISGRLESKKLAERHIDKKKERDITKRSQESFPVK